MSFTKTKRWLIRTSLLAATASGSLFAACGNNGPPRLTCADVLDGGVANELDVAPYTPGETTDAQPTSVYGMEPDPGPQCMDCTQGRDVEVMTIVDFEEGYAPAMFLYGEPGVLIEPQPAGGIQSFPYWGLQASDLSKGPGGNRCGSRFALHMEGGRFVSWGGGYVPLAFTLRGAPAEELCANPRETRQGIPPTISGAPGTPEATCSFYNPPAESASSQPGFDASKFDGISFWARRGPSGQPTLRVSLQDINTSNDKALADERLAWLDERDMLEPGTEVPEPACKRIRGCCRHCNPVEHEEIILDDAGTMVTGIAPEPVTENRCWVNEDQEPWNFEPGPDGGFVALRADGGQSDLGAKESWDNWNRDFKLCCERTMEEDPVNGDPKYGGKPCNPYVFQFDFSSGYFCWDPSDPPLPESNQNRCGDGFQANVIVDTEWKLYTIPWSELRRFTPDKPAIKPNEIWGVAFYFGAGYLDTYVDDVGFYKRH